jgi:hypothetical protein
VFIVQAYQASQYVVPRGGIFLGKWRSSFARRPDGKMNALTACFLNTRLLNNGSANKHISTATILLQQRKGVSCVVGAEML